MLRPAGQGNSELFVNVPRRRHPLVRGNTSPEYLLLVNGQDDNNNGWIDEGFDGVDNDGDWPGPARTISTNGRQRHWQGIPAPSQTTLPLGPSMFSVPYTIRRRPAPAPNAREIALPTSMVIDATSIYIDRERSRLPANNPLTLLTGYIDIVLNPDGTVLPTTTYSSPAVVRDGPVLLPFLAGRAPGPGRCGVYRRQHADGDHLGRRDGTVLPADRPAGLSGAASLLPGPYLKGEYSVLTLFARTGQIVVNANPPFLYDSSLGYNNQNGAYNANNPFIPAEQGVSGGP